MSLSFPRIYGIFVTLASIIGFIIYSIYYSKPGPINIEPVSTQIWITGLLFFVGLQIILITFKKNKENVASSIVNLILTIISFFIFLLYSIGSDTNAIWALVLTITNAYAYFLTKKSKHGNISVNYSDKEESRALSIVLMINLVFLCISILFTGLLLGGAGISARGISYSPGGKFMTVKSSKNVKLKIHYVCEGVAKNESFPVIILDSDTSHGIYDFWPLIRNFTNAGYRVCSFDKPGIGYSSYYPKGSIINETIFIYPQIIDGMGEKGPFILLGWGGGGNNVYQYALNNSENVSGLIFVDVYGDHVEWRFAQKFYNYTPEEAKTFAVNCINDRFFLFWLIRQIAVPWGIMSFVINNRSTYSMPSLYDEYMWFYFTAKTWVSQYFYLKESEVRIKHTVIDQQNFGLFNETSKFLYKLPVLQVYSNKSSIMICNDTSTYCVYNQEYNTFLNKEAVVIANMTDNPLTAACNDEDCSLSLPQQRPDFIVAAVQQFESNFKRNIKNI